MEQIKLIEKLLKNYEYNKVRIVFLQNQRQRLRSEESSEYIQSKMFNGGFSGGITKFLIENNEEIAKLNIVEATADNYKERIQKEYKEALYELDQELNALKYNNAIVDDSMELLKGINEKYYDILRKNYIYKCTMENIADSMHISRSRSYELRKAALRLIVKIVFGEKRLLHNIHELQGYFDVSPIGAI